MTLIKKITNVKKYYHYNHVLYYLTTDDILNILPGGAHEILESRKASDIILIDNFLFFQEQNGGELFYFDKSGIKTIEGKWYLNTLKDGGTDIYGVTYANSEKVVVTLDKQSLERKYYDIGLYGFFWNGLSFKCSLDKVFCVDLKTGKNIWEHPLIEICSDNKIPEKRLIFADTMLLVVHPRSY